MRKNNLAALFSAFILSILLNGCSMAGPIVNSEPTPEFIPGWKQYEIDNVTFQLPKEYQDITTWLHENYPEESPYSFFVAATVYGLDNSIETIFSLSRHELEERIIFEEYVDSYVSKTPPQDEILNRIVLDEDYPTEKIVTAIDKGSGRDIVISYLTFIGNFMYRIEFQCEESQYDSHKTEFNEIYETIHIMRVDNSDSLSDNYQGLSCLGVVGIIIFVIGLNAWLKRRRRSDDVTPLILPEDF